MQLDRYYSIPDNKAIEMAKMTKKELFKTLWQLPIYTGIAVEIREKKINELVDGLKEINKVKQQLDKKTKKLADDIKQLSPKSPKSKSFRNTGTDANNNTERQPDKTGKD